MKDQSITEATLSNAKGLAFITIAKGGFISGEEKNKIAEKYSYYSGLSKEFVLSHNLDVPNNTFWKELLRDRSGLTVGRLDSRYRGIDKREAGSSPDTNIDRS